MLRNLNMSWKTICLSLCIYGILKEFRPSESYVIPFLRGPRMNFTEDQVNNEILPIGIYASMICMIFVTLTTDWLKYKIVIVIQALCGVGIYTLLSVCTHFMSAIVVQILYGMFVATEVAYYTYIYSVVDVKYYKKVTSYTRAAHLVGRFLSGSLAQVLFSTKLVDIYEMNFLTLGSLSVATIWSLLLPSVKKNVLKPIPLSDFTTKVKSEHEGNELFVHSLEDNKMSLKYIKSMCNEYKSLYLMKWSFWMIAATCCFNQVLYYIQSLWESLSCDDHLHNVCSTTSEWNGAVDAVHTILSAVVTFLCGLITLPINKYSNLLIVITSIIQCITLYTSVVYNSIYISYVNYIIFSIIYQAMMTIASSEIATCINKDKHGFVFGLNNLLVAVLQSFVTFFMKVGGLSTSSRTLFECYASFCLMIAVFYLLITIGQIIKKST